MDYKILLKTISEQYQKLLQNNLVGIYVHGSIAFGCFSWDRSDIDFIVVVDHVLSKQMKIDLLNVLENLCPKAPQKGFEMSIVLKKYCRDFIYPTPYELHFSNLWRLEKYLEHPLLLCSGNVQTDYDLAAHFTVIKRVGLVLFGKPIAEVFGSIPRDNYLDSIRQDIENAKTDVLQHPAYIILNLCRVCAYLSDGRILSKEQGGRWGIKNLPAKYRPLIIDVLGSYADGHAITAGQDLQIEFCDFMLTRKIMI